MSSTVKQLPTDHPYHNDPKKYSPRAIRYYEERSFLHPDRLKQDYGVQVVYPEGYLQTGSKKEKYMIGAKVPELSECLKRSGVFFLFLDLDPATLDLISGKCSGHCGVTNPCRLFGLRIHRLKEGETNPTYTLPSVPDIKVEPGVEDNNTPGDSKEAGQTEKEAKPRKKRDISDVAGKAEGGKVIPKKRKKHVKGERGMTSVTVVLEEGELTKAVTEHPIVPVNQALGVDVTDTQSQGHPEPEVELGSVQPPSDPLMDESVTNLAVSTPSIPPEQALSTLPKEPTIIHKPGRVNWNGEVDELDSDVDFGEGPIVRFKVSSPRKAKKSHSFRISGPETEVKQQIQEPKRYISRLAKKWGFEGEVRPDASHSVEVEQQPVIENSTSHLIETFNTHHAQAQPRDQIQQVRCLTEASVAMERQIQLARDKTDNLLKMVSLTTIGRCWKANNRKDIRIAELKMLIPSGQRHLVQDEPIDFGIPDNMPSSLTLHQWQSYNELKIRHTSLPSLPKPIMHRTSQDLASLQNVVDEPLRNSFYERILPTSRMEIKKKKSEVKKTEKAAQIEYEESESESESSEDDDESKDRSYRPYR